MMIPETHHDPNEIAKIIVDSVIDSDKESTEE